VSYDPLVLSEATRRIVTRVVNGVEYRKYYRFRGGRWYGGIATADCVGCNLRCRFCWSWRVRDNPAGVGEYYSPMDVAGKLYSIARRNNYRQVRISGGEPTISMNHLVKVVETLESRDPGILFILETNGILLGAYREYARMLSGHGNLHVRVSLKGCNESEFHMLTGAKPEAFNYQLKALKNLLDEGVSCHPAIMLSFSSRESVEELKNRLAEIDSSLVRELEEEYVFLYPHVVELLRRHGLTPRVAYRPDNIPEELI